MSMRYLGPSFDLHSGGIDLIFPHHENEIAQSEGATGKPFARHWFHIAHLRVEDKKMSKSLGNLYTVDDVKSWGFEAQDLRYVLLSGHYRQPLNFRKDALKAGQSALSRFKHLAAALPVPSANAVADRGWGPFRAVFEALCEDLNTSKALGALHSAAGDLEKGLKSGSLSEDAKRAAADGLANAVETFGFDLTTYGQVSRSSEIPDGVQQKAAERQVAREAKDWGRADALRDELLEMGWVVKDTPDGPELNPA